MTDKYGGYRSKFEWNIAKDLKKRKIKFQYEPFKIWFRSYVKGAECEDCGSESVFVLRPYTPDFVLDNGVIIEAKGRFTSKERTKMLEVIESNPDLDIRMLFMEDNFLTKSKVQRYSNWCAQKKIDFAIGRVPKQWSR